MKKPCIPLVMGPSKSPTTTPCVVTFPVIAAVAPLPWIWWMGVKVATHGLPTSKLNTKSAAMASGGSVVSWSLTWAATTVTRAASPGVKSVVGLSTNELGPPVTAASWVPLVVHEIENHDPVTVTGSLKSMVTSVPAATPVAPLAGVVDVTAGAPSPPPHGLSGEEVLRGLGAPDSEVGRVVVGLGAAAVQPQGGRRVRERRRRRGLEEVRVAVADEVDDLRERLGRARRRAAVAAERRRLV